MKTASVLITVCCVASTAHGQLARNQILSFNNQICAGMKKQDLKGLEKLLRERTTSDFVYVEGSRTEKFDEMFEGMKLGLGMYTKINVVKSKVVSLKQNGGIAVALTIHDMAGTISGADDKPHKMTFHGSTTDTFKLQNGVWKLAKMLWLDNKITMDGKPFDPAKGGQAGH